MLFTTIAFSLIALVFDLRWQQAIAIGMILALIHGDCAAKPHRATHAESEAGQTSFSVLLFQDIAVIPMLVVAVSGTGVKTVAETSSMSGWQSGSLMRW